jgi:hypothetical protein
VTNPLTAAQEAHRAALAAQAAMHEASRKRDKAVQEARAAGVPAAALAAALGVNRHRIHAMLKAAEQK